MVRADSATASTNTLLLVDAASLYFRAFFGVKSKAKTPAGVPTNAVSGFLDMLATLANRFHPTHLVVCWDDDWRPAWRVELVPSYKAHRLTDDNGAVEEVPDDLAPQVPLIVEALTGLQVCRVGAAGYEADDVIGTLARSWSRDVPGTTYVVTGDRDLFQLIDDERHVRVVYPTPSIAQATVFDQAELSAKYAVATGSQYALMALLRGDASDGLPGVPGIGEKTGAVLASTFGSLENLMEAAREADSRIKPRARQSLLDHADYVGRATRVVAIDDAIAELETFNVRDAARIQVPNDAACQAFSTATGVRNSLGRLAEALTALSQPR